MSNIPPPPSDDPSPDSSINGGSILPMHERYSHAAHMPPINIKIINQGEDHSSGSGVDNETTTDYPIPNIRDNSEHNDSMPISVPNVDTLHDITPSNIDPPAKELDFNNLIIKKI